MTRVCCNMSAGIARIIQKKFLTAYDMQRLQLLLCNMRMVCDSTYLIDEKTNISPKLQELASIRFEQLDRMPERYPIYGEEPWKSRGCRRVDVDNYAVLYITDQMRWSNKEH